MNERERIICARVKEFREQVKWSQADFSAQLQISLNQLASIEYGRTPLRYDIAWRMRTIFGVSLEWLSIGEFSPDMVAMDDLPPPNSTGLTESALLSEVSDKVHGATLNHSHPKKRLLKIKIDKAEVNHRAFISLALKTHIDLWIASIPDGYTANFSDQFFKLANTYLTALPSDSNDLINARFDALQWEKLRRELRRIVPLEKIDTNQILTNRPTFDKVSVVKNLWPALKQRLQSATAESGKKSELAKFLKVDLTIVSRWMTDKQSAREPGAEYTLQMLHWVEQEERQK